MWPRTKASYAEYEASVAEFFAREKIENLTTCGADGYVTRHGCDCCGNPQQQVLYEATGYCREDDIILEFEVCEDCVYYAEYGRLDDMQMDEIESDKSDTDDNTTNTE